MADNVLRKRDGVVTTRLERVKQVVEQSEEKPKRKSAKRKVITGVPLDVVDNTLGESTVDQETKEG